MSKKETNEEFRVRAFNSQSKRLKGGKIASVKPKVARKKKSESEEESGK